MFRTVNKTFRLNIRSKKSKAIAKTVRTGGGCVPCYATLGLLGALYYFNQPKSVLK